MAPRAHAARDRTLLFSRRRTWNASDAELIETTVQHLDKLGFIRRHEARDGMVVRIPAATHCSRWGTRNAARFSAITWSGSRTAGRGPWRAFRYYNMDQAIASGLAAAQALLGRDTAMRAAVAVGACREVRAHHSRVDAAGAVPAPDGRFADQLLAAAGMLYIAAVLLKGGHEVRFFNGAFLTQEEILRRVGEFDPRFAGIYSTTFGWNKAMQTAEALKRLNRRSSPVPVAVSDRAAGAMPARLCTFRCGGTGEGRSPFRRYCSGWSQARASTAC